VRAAGTTRLDVAARGPAASPDLTGSVELADARLSMEEPRIGAENLDMRVTLAGPRVTLESLSGELNGGKLSGSGVLAYSEGEIGELDIQISATDVAFDAPLDLRSVSDTTLRVTRRTDEIAVEGQVTIKDAGLTGNINFDTGLLSAVTAHRQLDLTEQRSALLEQVRFNVNVDTSTPIVVDNNLARAEITTDLRVVGTPYETGLAGTLTLLEGGEITLNERRYQVERCIISFLDERRIVPSFDLRLNTTASRYAITVAVTGSPGDTDSSFTSEPTLPEPDIMALLITGRTLDDMRGEEYDVAREQVLSYLTGRVGSTLGSGLQRATGLSEVRIEPNLIANETDPGARLTVGQDLTSELKLVYSTNLADSSDQIWVGQYDITRRFQTKVVRQSDDSYRLDFRHDVRFGGRPDPGRSERQHRKVGTVDVPSEVDPGDAELRGLLRVKAGDTFDYFRVRRGVQRIERFYRDRGYLESRVRLTREQDHDLVNLELAVSLGPLVSVTFEGAPLPDKVRAQIQEQWRRGVFDAQRVDDTQEVIRAWLRRQQYFQPSVEVTAGAAVAGRRQVTVRVEPGARSDRVVLAFEGADQLNPDELASIVHQQDLEPQLFSDPLVVTELLERYYREQGFLAVHIERPRHEFDGAIARVVLDVQEGPRFKTTRIVVNGNRVYDNDLIVRDLPLRAGDTFLPAVAERSLERIRDLYWRKGYNDVRSDYSLAVNGDRGEVETTFTVREGRQSVVAEVTVEGTDRAKESLVRDELPVAQAQPLDLAVLGKARKNLYNTGAFSVVDLTREEVTRAETESTSPRANDEQPDTEKPERVRVAVREVQPFQLGYGASYDTERGLGGIFDVSNHNSLGKARVVGIRTRYDGQLREVRGYMSQPSLRSWPVRTTATLYYREERNPETTFVDAFNFDRRGLSIQQEKQLGNAYVWSYGYRYERVRTFSPVPGLRDETLRVSPLTSTFTREQRDDVLDASTGSFTSHAFSFSPSWLGSDVTYIKYFGQYFHYFPLQPVRRKPLTNELLRPRLVYAVGVRLGLAAGFGGSMPSAERFFAGGSSTIRGFEQNAVGPIVTDRVAPGGNALFVLNNELRVPLVSIIDGVVFADVGNAFARVRDFSFTDMREAAGVGLRLRTPWFLVRGDLGFVLDPRSGEPRSRFYFSIGQAF
jgi:outer membrane protein assembly complex protein YaeT